MTITLGPLCERDCGRGVYRDGLCARCWSLLRR